MGFYGSQWAGIGGLWMNPGASQRRRGLKGLKEPVVAGQNRAKIARLAPARPNSKSLHLLASRAPPFRAGCPGPEVLARRFWRGGSGAEVLAWMFRPWAFSPPATSGPSRPRGPTGGWEQQPTKGSVLSFRLARWRFPWPPRLPISL